MKSALIALLFVAAVFAGDYATEDSVLVLTDKTFDSAIAEFDFVLAEFYAPWCGHCKKLTPEYAAAAQQLAGSFPNVRLAKIDCTVEKELASRFEIRGFPTLKFFIKGASAPIAYEGGRTAPEIVQWLKKKTGPVSVPVSSVEDAQKLVNDNQVVVFYLGAEGSELNKAFLNAAANFDDLSFAHSTEESVRQHYEADGDKVIIFKKFDEGKNIYSGAADATAIKNFINDNRFPTILPFEQKTAQKIFGEGLNTLFLVRGADEAGEKAEAALRSASEYLKGKITLAVARLDDAFGPRLAEYIGVAKEKAPAFRLVQPSKNNLKFLFEHEITVDNLKAFYHDFVDNKLKPFFKSADIPANPHEDNVKVIVGKNYKEVVLDSDDDVLVEYYAPWCGHCKSLAPIYSSLAGKVHKTPGVVIAKMDATANEVEGLNIQGFPTIKFYPKGKKNSPIEFNGDRTEEGFIKFLKENAVNFPKSNPSLDEL